VFTIANLPNLGGRLENHRGVARTMNDPDGRRRITTIIRLLEDRIAELTALAGASCGHA
jgi:hypothetical protein